jgi:hypothetical protein
MHGADTAMKLNAEAPKSRFAATGEQMIEPDEPKFEEVTAIIAHDSDGLVWWRPDGVISDNPDADRCLVRRG